MEECNMSDMIKNNTGGGKLLNRNALITGCNRGIGKSIMETFMSEGANIIACTRTLSEETKQVYQQYQNHYGITIWPIEMDLSDEESIKAGMKEVASLHLALDILVNNAGMAIFKPMMMTRLDEFKRIMQVNLYAPLLITQYAIKKMLKQKRGSIIYLSSVSGFDPNAGNSAYGASKAAIASLTRTIAVEFEKSGIRSNAIAPGFIETDMNHQISPSILDDMKKNIFMGRFGSAEEVAKLALFLASDESVGVNGQVIRIDGGI